jgi:hypothetical protein
MFLWTDGKYLLAALCILFAGQCCGCSSLKSNDPEDPFTVASTPTTLRNAAVPVIAPGGYWAAIAAIKDSRGLHVTLLPLTAAIPPQQLKLGHFDLDESRASQAVQYKLSVGDLEDRDGVSLLLLQAYQREASSGEVHCIATSNIAVTRQGASIQAVVEASWHKPSQSLLSDGTLAVPAPSPGMYVRPGRPGGCLSKVFDRGTYSYGLCALDAPMRASGSQVQLLWESAR